MKYLIIIILFVTSFSIKAQVIKFETLSCDLEMNGQIIRTYTALSYHTFDFDNRKVTLEVMDANGSWDRYVYPLKDSYKEEGLLGTTYVITVRDQGLREVWFSIEANNLGYDFLDGSRFAYYEVQRIK